MKQRLRVSRTGTFRTQGRAGLSLLVSAGLVAGALVAGVLPGVVPGLATPAAAEFATGGSGLHRGSIDWFEWSDTANQAVPAAGMTKTNSRIIAGQTLDTTCVITDVAGSVKTYRPGSYSGDALDDLYNVGGTGAANTMIIGLANQVDGALASFRVSCSATLNGAAVPLQGLVFADAEASTSTQGEYISARPDQATTWRIIDRYRAPDCTTSTVATVGTDGSMRLGPDGRNCSGGGPMAVGFMEGATSALMTVQGGGVSAVALGVVLQTDFGDAPESYGEAGALLAPRWSGGEVGVGTTPVSDPSFVLGTPDQPNTRLGATVDSEATHQFSADALGDDVSGNTASDEDAIPTPETARVTPGETHTLRDVACTGPGFVAGWIDWNANGSFDAGERSALVECTGTTVDLAWEVPADAVSGDTFLRLRIAETEAGAGAPTGITTAGEVEDYALAVQLPELTITKVSDAGDSAYVGQVVQYTVALENVGDTDFTDAYPARFSDDLSAVLDDANYNNDAAVSFSDGTTGAAPTVAAGTLTWAGPLQAGERATFTYSVTLTRAGDGAVVNTACVPSELAADDENCASTRTELPKLTLAKTSDIADLPENGGTVTYEVTVTNQGPGDATAAHPAAFSDDLSDVLDDGDFVDGSIVTSTGDAVRSGNTLEWTGALAAGASATVTYQVEYQSTKGGDNRLVNVACLPIDLAANPNDLCRQVEIPGAALQQWKTADPASGAVATGDEITYTLHFRNTGQTAVSIDNSDDLSQVIDDAVLIAGPTASTSDLVTVLDGSTVRVTGTVQPGSESTVQYTVQVAPAAERGDSVLTNALAQCEANNTALCDPIQHRVPHLSIVKDADVESATVGDTVTYTIRITNDGTAAYTDERPASFSDDLTAVLDDASMLERARASTGVVSYSAPTLSWEGALEVQETATISYSVTVTNAGDHELVNTVCAPNAGEAASCDSNTVQLPHLTAAKSVDPTSGTQVVAGQLVTYTLSFTNDGTAAAEVNFSDNLADVLDDADFADGPTVSDPAIIAVRAADRIGVTGNLAAGQTATVSYSVLVRADGARGNNVLGNVLADANTSDPQCGDDGVWCTENPMGELVTWKSVDPASGTTLRAGDTATYTLHFENTGTAPVSVLHDDVLTQVLDDADLTGAPQASTPAVSVSELSDGRVTTSGTLAAGESATVTYTVTVKADGARGDDRLANFLVPEGSEPPEECAPQPGDRPNCTVNPVSEVSVTKSADPVSGTEVQPGDEVTYTLTFTNRSVNSDAAAVPVDYTDHLTDVLDDATLVGTPSVMNAGKPSGDITATVVGDTIRVIGAVPTGDTVLVHYTVRVNDFTEQGNHSLGNVVAVTGEAPVCAPDSPLCTVHDVSPQAVTPPGLAVTGGSLAMSLGVGGLAGLMILLGIWAILRRRGVRSHEVPPLP